MAYTQKKWSELYSSVTTPDTADIGAYLSDTFDQLSSSATLSSFFSDGDSGFLSYFTTNFGKNPELNQGIGALRPHYFRINQMPAPPLLSPRATNRKTETPFYYMLKNRYRGMEFYNSNLFGIKTVIDTQIDTELGKIPNIQSADKTLFKGALLQELIAQMGYKRILWDFFKNYKFPNNTLKSATVEELLRIYGKKLKAEGYNLKNLGATSNTPTPKSAREILGSTYATAARKTVSRNIANVEPAAYAEGDLQRFFQCALMSDLFVGPSGTDIADVNSYAKVVADRGGYRKKIYPVGFQDSQGSSQPGNFMNKLLYPSSSQDFFQNTEDIYPPDNNNAGWYNGEDNNKNHELITKSIHFVEKVTDTTGKVYLHEVDLTDIENLTNPKEEAAIAVSAGNIAQLKSILNTAKALPLAAANKRVAASVTGVSSVSDLETQILGLTFEDDANEELIIFDGMTISFNGTNPSTARKDVKVDLKFTLTSLSALTSKSIGTKLDKTELFLKDLVTVPDAHSGGSPVLKNDYSPDFNRIRVKVKACNSDKVSYLAGSDLILDLAVIDHSLNRGPENGTVSFTINYRGFFNSALSMPFMDCLVENIVTQKRITRSNGFNKLVKAFPDTVPTSYPQLGDFTPADPNKAPVEADLRNYTKAMRKSFAKDIKNVSGDSFIKRLVAKKYIREYTLTKTNMFKNFINDGFFDYDQSLSGTGFVNVTMTSTTDTDTTIIKKIQDNKKEDEAKKETSSVTTGYFFYFGDLIDVITDSIYASGNAGVLLPEFKHLNLKFLISDIEIYDPVYKKRKVINPCQIPIDVSFFAQWINDVVLSKSLTFFPINQMIISLAERLIGSLLYDICYGDTFANETPPRMRVGFFQDCRDSTDNKLKTALSDIDDKKAFRKLFKTSDLNGEPIIYRDAAFKLDKDNQSTTYCVIYMQSPPFLLPMSSGKVVSYRLKGLTPQINYGKRFISFNKISNVSFTKTDQPFLREARYFNNRALSMISNVYDLSFSFKEVGKKASTVLYPATTIEMYLRDWAKASDWFPHYKNSQAGLLGFGGYFGISSVTYNLGVNDKLWTIDVKTKFLGTDASATVPVHVFSVASNIKTQPSDGVVDGPTGSIVTPGSSSATESNGDDVPVEETPVDTEETPVSGDKETPAVTNGSNTPDTLDPKSLPQGYRKMGEGIISYNDANYVLNADKTEYEKL